MAGIATADVLLTSVCSLKIILTVGQAETKNCKNKTVHVLIWSQNVFLTTS